MGKNLLITAAPGTGKTTVLRRVVQALGGVPVQGFLTDELRVGGQRVGFRIETLDGQDEVLAHVELRSDRHVGRYGVDVDALERMVGSALRPRAGTKAFLLDEIGKMECLSSMFVAAVEGLLADPLPLVATIAQKGGGPIAKVKGRLDVEIVEVTRHNRDELPATILRWLADRGVAPAG